MFRTLIFIALIFMPVGAHAVAICNPCLGNLNQPGGVYGDGMFIDGCFPCPDNSSCALKTDAIDCYSIYCDAGYYETGDKYAGTMVCNKCPSGTICPEGTTINDIISCDAGQFPDSSTLSCKTCPNNTYSDAGDAECTPCPNDLVNSGGDASAHAGVDSCHVQMCEKGATVLHVGDYEFPLWPDGRCSQPALYIGLSDGICCVNLSAGTGQNALHIEYNGEIYHTTN